MTKTVKEKTIYESTHILGGLDVGTGGRATLSNVLIGSAALAGQIVVSSATVSSTTVTVTGAASGDFSLVTYSGTAVGTAGVYTSKIVTANTVQVDFFIPTKADCVATMATAAVLTAIVIKAS